MIKVKDINIDSLYRIESYIDEKYSEIYDITISLCLSKNNISASFKDVFIDVRGQESQVGFEWLYQGDEHMLKIEYFGNIKTHPEYFL